LASCGQKKTRTDYIAKVNDSYFTQKDLDAAFDSLNVEESIKKEYVRNWVEREVLFQEAQKEEIMNDAEFTRIMNETRKELAKSFLIKKLLSDAKITVTPSETEKYYENNKEEFRVFFDAFVINIIRFRSEDRAIQFRSSAIETGWYKASLAYSKDNEKLSENQNQLVYAHQLQSASISNIIRELSTGEISIVINSGTNDFTVVQLINKFSPNDIPPIDAVRDEIQKRLIAKKKQEFLQNHLKELYTKYDVEIRN